ncbi:MAG TPA: hypothetical protein VGR28_10420 [Candidatus Thermoplasmatota archaeon]|jgi:hypothetical protein|nr:hypothetical protein [Candidatus Thermoplasmatota archaeon]
MRGILLAIAFIGFVALAAPAGADTDHNYGCAAALPDSLTNCVTHCATHVVADVQALTPGFPPCLLHP